MFVELVSARSLSYLLEKEGFRLERKKEWFEIKGVPESLVKASSARREELLEATSAYGGESRQAKEVARLQTRTEKEMVPRSEYFARWQERAESHGLTAEYAKTLVGPVPARDPEAELKMALDRALQLATAENSHFTESELLRWAATESQCRGIDPSILRHAVRTLLAGEKVVRLGRERDEVRYTTPQMLALEKDLLLAAARMHEDKAARRVTEKEVERAIELTEEKETRKARTKNPDVGRVSLTAEQREAVLHATQAPGRIKIIEGLAGTGKTALLDAVREAYEREGLKVIGTVIAGKAVRGLSEGAGIKSYTVAKLVGAPELDYVGDFDRRDDQTHKGKKPKERVTLDKNTVLVVEEAGMVGTRAFERLVREADRTGATVIAVGDPSQLQPVATFGGPMKSLAERLGSAKLQEITRQKKEWERRAVKQLQEGEAKEALKAYAERGLVWVEKTRDEAMSALVSEWRRSGGALRPHEHQVFVSTNEERRRVNALIQEALREEGKLGSAGIQVKGGEAFSGDRVMFLRRSAFMGVENGDMGTVRRVNPFRNTLEVELDRGGSVTVNMKRYGHQNLTHSFAITVHKGQGATTDFSYLLAGGGMTDLHLAYVQGSRARHGAKYFTDAFEAGDDLHGLVRQFSRRREKDLAHDVLDRAAAQAEVEQGSVQKRAHELELTRERRL
jgi:ATP-dependent exoDNAse (exonuclease V) alpha subunit